MEIGRISKLLLIGICVSVALSVFLILFNLKISVEMKQTQHQDVKSSIYNVNNNQNININMMIANANNKKLVYKWVRCRNGQTYITEQINEMTSFQKMYLKIYNDIIYYPVLSDVSDPVMISVTNSSTNTQTLSKTNKSIWNFWR